MIINGTFTYVIRDICHKTCPNLVDNTEALKHIGKVDNLNISIIFNFATLLHFRVSASKVLLHRAEQY